MLGADPSDLADVHARMERAIRPSFSVGQPLAKAAIDLACYDLWGKAVGKPVCDLLGGARLSEVRLSWTINSTSLDQTLRNLKINRLWVTGIVTEGCVELTARDAADRGYFTTLVSDALASSTHIAHYDAMQRMTDGGLIKARNVDQLCAQLAGARQKETA